jgi:hypothetical protein
MKPITFIHRHDSDLKITVALPAGQAGEDAIAEYVDAISAGNKYQAAYDLTRLCAVEPTGEALSNLLRIWSGACLTAAQAVYDALDFDLPKLLDPREVVANYEKHQVTKGMPSRESIEQWIRQYPRKGPPGEAQFGLAIFDWGVVPYRAPEPTEWFAVEPIRKAGKGYAVLRSFVQSCVLADVESILERNKSNPLIVPTIGRFIRNAAGEDFAQRMGE